MKKSCGAKKKKVLLAGLLMSILLTTACLTTTSPSLELTAESGNPTRVETAVPDFLATLLPPTRVPGAPLYTPTPDPPHDLPEIRSETEQYVVQPNDTLNKIASRYGVSLNTLISANEIENPNYLEIGQLLVIPPPDPLSMGPDLKIIPDSELINGPYAILLDIENWIADQDGFLESYEEEINGSTLSGAEIIEKISLYHSVNPRLLIAILEYQSRWVTKKNPDDAQADYPLFYDPYREGLYAQLNWAANNLNRGYYLWEINGISSYILTDESVVPAAPTINPGTAGVQYLMSLMLDHESWQDAVTENGVLETYTKLFGYPFDYAIEPLIPNNLAQPALQLPFERNTAWSYTGGPHAAWGDGSAWAALDFAPSGEPAGCFQSDAWVAAMADGVVTYSDTGVVIQDLDGDGYDQTGWSLLYLHIESRDRVPVGTFLQAGDRIGHPSCEGGISTGSHVHIARRYNGEWISADGTLPFNLDGWVSEGYGIQYDGYLRKDGSVIEAVDHRDENNQIER